MSIRIKKKSKFYKLIEENQLLDNIIFGYLGANLCNLLLMDKIIYHTIKGRIRYYIKSYNKLFANAFSEFIEPLQEKTIIKASKTAKGETKLNIPIYFSIKNLKKCTNIPIQETSYTFSYSYELNRKNKTKQYAWSSQFYITAKESRTLWIYKESHNYAEMPAYSMDVMCVRNDDILCVTLPFYNFGKCVSKFTFYPLQASSNIACECQVQKLYAWSNQYKSKKALDFQVEDIVKGRPDQFKTKSIKYSPLENNYRLQLECNKLIKYTKLLDFPIKCVAKNSPTIVFLKKKGCYNDESSILELRQMDTLIIYFMKS